MSTISQQFDAAILADAAYLEMALAPGEVLTGTALRQALLRVDNPDDTPRMSEAQAQYISDHYALFVRQGNLQRDSETAWQPGEYQVGHGDGSRRDTFKPSRLAPRH